MHALTHKCTSLLLQQYDPELDRRQFEQEIRRMSTVPAAQSEMSRMHVVDHDTFERVSIGAGAKV